MPLKDHKQELRHASDIATLVKHAAIAKLVASFEVGHAIKALSEKRQQEEEDARVFNTIGTTWGAW